MNILFCVIVIFTGCCFAQDFPSYMRQGPGFPGQNYNGTFPHNITSPNIGYINGPNINGYPNLNGLPNMNGLPKMNGLPNNNGLPNMNGLPNINGFPNMNGLPNINGIPNMNGTSGGENIERPCEVYDTFCIRQYFANNANCKAVYGPVPEPFYRPQSTSYIPNSNMTTTLTNIEVKGLNGRIEEFYINRVTDRLVMAVEFRGLSLNSTSAFFRFHRRSREPIVTSDSFTIVYQSVISTIIIPNARNLQLDQSEAFSYVNDAPSTLTMGPGLSNNSAPEVTSALTELTTNIMISIREILLTDGAFYPTTFIQWNICDFGLRVL